LIDAVLLRPLPVANPHELYAVNFEGTDDQGKVELWDSCSYPMFLHWRAALRGKAEIFAVSQASRVDITYATDNEMEKAYRGYVSGWMFGSFGLKPAAGRLLTEDDDGQLKAHANAVLSYDYWQRRFGGDRGVVGRHVTIGNDSYQIVGVAPRGFTGTEPGDSTDIFVPATMSPWAGQNDATWFRTLARVRPGQSLAPIADQLLAIYKVDESERSKSWSSIDRQLFAESLPRQKIFLAPATSGVSSLQKNYGPALIVLGVFVALVLLIACANVANLLTAQAAARAREMALRISLGAARLRLIQLVLVESALLAVAAAALGAVFAWWAAPFVVARINPPDTPVRLELSADWRVLGFGLALTFLVTLLFGLAPALRASGTKPLEAIKGALDPHSRRRAMHVLIGAQAAFCFVVLLFLGTIHRDLRAPFAQTCRIQYG
jgi:putative ABC transport system permease protein